ncbi:MAG: LamG domain-containing protein, partial [Chloroflexi bacterium]|nr:LamG domain-containing protein [Chloroflexota bacterium]
GVTAFGDSSGWGNTAVCDNFANACPTSGEDGRFGSAIAFDGNDALSIAAGNINLANQSFTLSAWAKRNAPGADNYIINQGSTVNNTGLLFGFRSDNLFTCAFWGNDLNSPVAYTDTEWHHWACSYNADTSTRTLYRDGLQVAQDTASAHYQGSGALFMGRGLAGGYFSGLIDEVAIFTTDMAADEVMDLMNGRYNPNDLIVLPDTPLTYHATVTNTSPTRAINGHLVADSQIIDPAVAAPNMALRFEEEDYIFSFNNGWETGESAYFCPDQVAECATDGATESNTATCIYNNGSCPTIGESGRRRYAVRFDGVDDVINMPSLGPARSGQILAFWINVDSLPSGGQLATILDTASEEMGALDIYINSGGNLIFDIAGHGSYTSGDSFNGGWHQAVFSKDGSNLTLFHGYNIGTSVLTPTPANVPDIFIGPATVGNSVDGSQPFTGRLDDFVFYNEFFPDQAPDFYHSYIRNGFYFYDGQISPSFLLEFDENTILYAPTVHLNGVGFDIFCDSAAACPTLTSNGVAEEAAVFDGIDDYLPLSGAAIPNLDSGGGGFKMEGWFKVDYLPTSSAYLLDGTASNIGLYIMPYVWVNNVGQITVSFRDENGVDRHSATTSPVFFGSNLGQWVYLEIWMGNNAGGDFLEYSVEVNDVNYLNGTYSYGGLNFFYLVLGDSRIGSANNDTSYFNGNIDNLIIQTDQNERTIYDMPFNVIGRPTVELANRVTDGMVASCVLEDGRCPAREDNGRFGSTFNFDGDDYFTIDNIEAGNFAQSDYTIAAWFNSSASGSPQTILAAVDPASDNHGVLLELTSSGTLRYLHRFPVGVSGGSNIYSSAAYNDGQWHHLVAVRQGSEMELYVDNVLVGTNTAVTNPSNSLELVIGRYSPTMDQQYFNGRLDELLILPEAVDADGVNLLYQTTYPNIVIDGGDFVPYTAAPSSSLIVSGTAQVNPNAITSQHLFAQEVEAALDTGNIDIAA